MKKFIKLFDKLMSNAAGYLLLVEEHNDKVLANNRLTICENNSNTCFNSERRVCRMCHCYIDEKVKMLKNINILELKRVEMTHCPLGKWGEDDKKIANHYRKEDGKKLLK